MNTIDAFKEKMKKYWNIVIDTLKKYDNKRNRIIALCAVALIVGVSSYLWVSRDDSRTKTINKFEVVLKSRNPYNVYKQISFENKGIKLNDENIKPFVDYINSDETRRDEILRSLRFDNSEGDKLISVKNDGNKYFIELKGIYMTLSTNLKDTEIYLQDKLYCRSDRDNYSEKFGPLIPGIYDIRAKIKGPFGEIESSDKFSLISKNSKVDIPVKAVNVSVEGNYTDSKVFINGEDTGKTIDQFKNIGPMPSDGSLKIHVEKNFPWSVVKSEEKAVEHLSYLRFDLNPMTEELRKNLEVSYNEFYKNFFEALNKEDINLITGCTEKVKKSLYVRYNKKSLIISNSYNLEDLKWQKDAISIENKDGIFSTFAIADVSYKEKKSLSIIPLNEEKKNVSFKTVMTYNTESNKWIVTEVSEI